MKNWKNSVYALFAMMCVLIFAGCQPVPNGTKPITDTTTGTGGTKPTGTTPGSTGGSNGLNTVEKAIIGSFKLPDGIVFKFNSDRTGTKTTPSSGNIRAAQPVQNFTWKADTSGNVSITFKDGSASPVVKFDMNRPNEIKIDGDVAIKDGATDLNEYERKLVGTWYSSGAEMVFTEDRILSWMLPGAGGDIRTAKATWNSTADTLTVNWYEATINGQILSGQEKENFFHNYFEGNPTVWKYTWNDNDNVTYDLVYAGPTRVSRKPFYEVEYYTEWGTIKTEYVKIGEDYNIDFKYGENVFEYAGIPKKYWNPSDWIFGKYITRINGSQLEYKRGDNNAKIQSPTSYQRYNIAVYGTDNRADVIIGYKAKVISEEEYYYFCGDTYWFYDGNFYTKRNGVWRLSWSEVGLVPDETKRTIKVGDIIEQHAYIIENRNLKCIGWVKSSLTSISASDIYERADPEIAWSESSPIELVPVFAAR